MEKMTKVEIFNQIRDIPYHIATKGEKGTACADKAMLLISELEKIGVEARFIVALMKWSSLDLPDEVMQVPHDDESSHAFAQVKNLKGEWVYVDPTWNPELRKSGLLISEWDGENTTGLGIDCYKIFSAEESIEYMKHIDYENDLKENGAFYEAINKYCDSFLTK